MTVTVPRLAVLLDWVAVDRAAAEVTAGLAVTLHVAALHATRARLSISADSLRIDAWDGRDWVPVVRWPGPAAHGVAIALSNPTVVFEPLGTAWGLSNTTVRLSRGSHLATVTTSRVGRVKRS